MVAGPPFVMKEVNGMKKLLALVLAALLLFSMPVASARADGEDPAAEPPAPERPCATS